MAVLLSHRCTPTARTADAPLHAQTRYALHEAAALLGTSGVHFASRLDAATSGVLVAATSPRAAHALQAVWTGAGVVVKEYIALVSR